MPRRPALLASTALVLGLLPALGGAASAAPTSAAPSAPVAEPAAVARGVIVKTKAADATLRRAVQRAAGSDADVQAPRGVSTAITTVDFDQVLTYAEAADVAAEVAQRPDVEWAIPNGRVKASAAAPNRPNDPRFDEQLQLWDAKAKAAGGYSTKAPAAWAATKGDGVVVAVVDTGVRPKHPDLTGRLVTGYDFVGEDLDGNDEPRPTDDPFRYYTSNDGDGRDTDPSDPGDWIPEGDEYCYGEPVEQEDSSWHGTHVAGIVAATQNDGHGISGVAPSASILPVRVLGRCGGWDADVIAGIEWASGGEVPGAPVNENPAQVVNLSLGSTVPAGELAASCEAYGSVARDAMARGSVVVAAAGNDFGAVADRSVPAACPGVISVGATNLAGRAAVYSNTGKTVDLSAYGGDLIVEKRGVLSSVDSGRTSPVGPDHASYQGTSMAAPAVAGAAALLMSLDVPAASVETELEKAVQPFAGYSKAAKKTKVKLGGKTRTFDTNCTTKKCGKGVLDLSRIGVTVGLAGVPAKEAFGTNVQVTVDARLPVGGAAWQGPVELRRGTQVLARGAVDASGTAVLTVRGTDWTIGKNAVRAVLAHGTAASRTVTVTVAKAPSEITQEVSDTVDPATRPTLTATVVVADGVPAPTGTVTVYDGKKKIASTSLKASQGGQVVLTLPKLKKGTHTLKTVYGGSKTIAGSTSPAQRVVSATPSAVR